MIKMIHCADLHLDSPMETHLTEKQASVRNTEIIHSFLRLTQYAEDNAVCAVIIAGDLFDGARVKSRTVDAILNAMAGTPGVDYLYLAGNHDAAGHAFAGHDLPKNLKCFGREWKSYRYGNVMVSGIETCAENAASLYETVPQQDGMLSVVTMHGQLGTSSGTDQVNVRLLRNRGIAYLALGHLHSYSEQKLDDHGICCYSGCLEGRGFDECGPKGFVLLEMDETQLQHRFVPFSCRQLHRVPVDISGLTGNAEIFGKMLQAAEAIPAEDMVEFVLTGAVDPTANLAVPYLENLMARQDFFFSKVKDETHMAIHPEDYEKDISLKGEFIRLVLASDAAEEDKAAMIRAGMQALMGEEITL